MGTILLSGGGRVTFCQDGKLNYGCRIPVVYWGGGGGEGGGGYGGGRGYREDDLFDITGVAFEDILYVRRRRMFRNSTLTWLGIVKSFAMR